MTVPIDASTAIGGRVDVVQLALRCVVGLAGLSAIASIRLAASEPEPVLDLALALFVAVSMLFPDGHAGLAVVALVGLDWALAVDDPSSPWVMVAGVSLAVFHASLALVTIAPIGARPTRATRWRWARRTVSVAALVPAAWVAVVAVDRVELGASQILVGSALLVVGGVAMWSRRGELR